MINKKQSVLDTVSGLGRSPLLIVAVVMYGLFVIAFDSIIILKLIFVPDYGDLMALDAIEVNIRLFSIIGFIFILIASKHGRKNVIITGLRLLKIFCMIFTVFAGIDSLISSIMTSDNIPAGFTIPFLFDTTLTIDFVILLPCVQICMTVIRVAFYAIAGGFIERIIQSVANEEAMPDDGIGVFVFMIIITCDYIIEGLFNFEFFAYIPYAAMCALIGIWIFKYRKTMTVVYRSGITEEET